MTGILCVGDVHLADRPPSGCTDAYLDEQWAVLEEALEIAAERKLIPVFAGDIFHSKTATKNSHSLVRRLIGTLQKCPIKPLVVIGNHDITHDRLDSLNSQPLGVVLESGVLEELVGWYGGSHTLAGAPWGSGASTMTKHASLVVAHAPIYPPGQAPPWGDSIDAEEWAKVQQRGYCYYGHIHDFHGIYEVDDSDEDYDGPPRAGWNVTFCNAGALTRGSLVESERVRKPAVAAWMPDTGFEIIELQSPLPADEILRIAESEQVKKQRADAEDFLAQLEGATHSSLAEAVAEIKRADVPENVRNAAVDLIDQAS